MTNEQLARSIAQLTKLHESRTKINSDQLTKTTSHPSLNKKLAKLQSVNSLLSEYIPTKKIQTENKTLLTKSSKLTDFDKETTPAISSPLKHKSLPKRKLSQENIQTIQSDDLTGTSSTLSSPIIQTCVNESSKSKIETSNSASTKEQPVDARNESLERSTMNQSLKNFSSCSKISDRPSQSSVLL